MNLRNSKSGRKILQGFLEYLMSLISSKKRNLGNSYSQNNLRRMPADPNERDFVEEKINMSDRILQRIQEAEQQRLDVLDLNNLGIDELLESIGNLSDLTGLYLANNQLTNLPESIGNLANLTKLNLEGNPLQKPPLEIATKGVQAIKEYFEQLRREGQDSIYERFCILSNFKML